jgi:hypothetical protein
VFDLIYGIITVSENPGRYPSDGMFFCCDPQSGAERMTAFPLEVVRLVQAARDTKPDAGAEGAS